MIEVRPAQAHEADWIQARFNQQWPDGAKPSGYFARCCAEQARGEIVLLIAVQGDDFLGAAKIVWQPDYPYFRETGIPEIQDLNVMPPHRRRGVASRLMDAAEAQIARRAPIAGIGVGLYADYGPAQQMYVRRGYVPDGRGVVYKNAPVLPGQSVPVDDDLVLHLLRRLAEG